MPPDIKPALRATIFEVLDPLVRMLIEAGVQVGDFESIARIAYARAGRQIIREALGETNNSRVHIVTGIPRKDLPQLFGAIDREFEPHGAGRHRAERVLAGWYNDPDFQTRAGLPAALPLDGASRSFAALCKRYSGDSRIGSLRGELLRVGAIRARGDGLLEALRREYASVRWNPEGVAAMGEQLAEHIAALAHNLQGAQDPRLVKRVINVRLNRRFLPGLRRELEEHAQEFADLVDRIVNHPAHTADPDTPADDVRQLGMGLYVIEKAAEEPARSADSDAPPSAGRRTTRSGKKKRKK